MSHVAPFSAVILLASTSLVSALTLPDAFTSFYVLGDSNSDWGNFGADGPPPPYFNGQFSNGPVWADILDDGFETGDPDDIRTWNYAFGGARVTNDTDAPDLPEQLELFAADLDPTIDDPLFGTPVLGERPLVSIWFGANDIRSIYQTYLGAVDDAAELAEAEQAQVVAAARVQALDEAATVGAIYGSTLEAAAQAPNVNDLLALSTADAGLTPEYDDPADATLLNELSVLFNHHLAHSLSNIAATGVNVYSVDVFGLQQDVLANPAAFGFDNVTDPCLSFDATGAVICDTPETYLYWDDVGHLSGAAQAALAGIVEQTVLSDLSQQPPVVAPVPLPGALPAMGLGLLLLGALRTRRVAGGTP